MRKLILSAFITTIALGAQAQNLDDIQEKISKQKYGEAREKIDKALQDPKAQKNANLWYYKGLVYGELAKDSSKTDMDYRMESFNALKKYQELDPKNIMLTLNQNSNFFALYEGYYNTGIKAFNQKDYAKAYSDLSNALRVKDYVYDKKYEYNGFKFNALDTVLVNLTASAAYLAKQEDSSIMYYRMLADAKVKGDDYKELYPLVVDYYSRKKDEANKAKYTAIGKEVYPDNPYWMQTALDEAGDDKGKRIAKYKELMNAQPENGDLAIDYAVELFNYVYQKDKPKDFDVRVTELDAALANAVAKNPKSPYASYIYTQHLGNEIYDMQQAYAANKGTKPEDIKKRQEMNKKISSLFEEQAKHSQTAYDLYAAMDATAMKPLDKKAQRDVTNNLIDFHRSKKQLDKAKVYEDKLKTYR